MTFPTRAPDGYPIPRSSLGRGLYYGYLRYLTYALAAEKADKYLWKWLTSPYVPEYARSWSRDERRQWKGRALRQFVESKVCWADKPADQLHVGMETFTTAIALTADAREASYIPKGLAGRWLVQQYMSPGQRTVRVEDHEQMTELIRTYSFEPYEQWFETARMQMAHPTKPRADEAFAFFMASEETQAKSNFVRNMINPKDGKVASLLFFMVVKAAQQLDGAGRTVEARTLLDFGRRRMPAYFTSGQYYNPHKHQHAPNTLDSIFWDAKNQVMRDVPLEISDRRRQVSESFSKYNQRFTSGE
ncbi:hypothetical protein LTR56_005019 [Elasticomyces elasticus]|nr:hypothetical protein LTR22_022320 [Elasticomyces elasticus]KAK3652725.1 hypothetical protein LTR56_005019 [Elasticomyces elasticus]KAK5748408.1 hypothetical protein LTS12_021536 [Elasticomyces elasticus]